MTTQKENIENEFAVEKLYDALEENGIMEGVDIKTIEIALKRIELDLKTIRKTLKTLRKTSKPSVLKG